MKKVLIVLILLMQSFVANAWVDDSQDEEPRAFQIFVAGEALVMVNAGMASAAPEIYGAVACLFAPLGLSGDVSEATNLATLGAVESMGLYNIIELRNEDQYSKSDVFVRNIAAWHLIAGVHYLTEKFTGERYLESNHLTLKSNTDGLALQLRLDF